MITAKEATDISSQNSKIGIKEIEQRIKNAAKKGKTSVSYFRPLTSYAQRKLRQNGFDIGYDFPIEVKKIYWN